MRYSPCAVTDVGLAALIGRFRTITSVRLCSPEDLTADGLAMLAISSLRNLVIEHVDFGSDERRQAEHGLISALSGCPALESLKLSGAVTAAVVGTIAAHCPRLKSVTLGNCRDTTEAGVLQLATALPLLEFFDCQVVYTDVLLAEIVACCPRLLPDQLRVDLIGRTDRRNGSPKADAFIQAVAKQHPDLASLNLKGAIAVTDIGLETIATSFPKLTCLDLGSQYFDVPNDPNGIGIDSVGIELSEAYVLTTLATGCPLLERFESSADLSDDALATLVRRWPNMHPDKLGCSKLWHGDAFAAAVAETHPGIKEFNLVLTGNLTGAGLNVIAAACTQIERLSVRDRPPRHFYDDNLHCARFDQVVHAIIAYFPKLKHLDLRLELNSELFSDEVLGMVAAAHPDLEGLWAHEGRVTEDGACAALRACPRMRPSAILEPDGGLKGVPMGDAYLAVLSELHPDLKHLSLSSRCETLTDHGLAAIPTLFPELERLMIMHQHEGVTDAGVNRLRWECPFLSVDYVPHF